MTASADTTNRVGRVRLSVQIKDFGPISSGSIEIRPLTLFIGPNNSGKSYAAMLIHALLESYTPFEPYLIVGESRMRHRILYRGILENLMEGVTLKFKDFIDEVNRLEVGSTIVVPRSLIQSALKETWKYYERRLSDEIARFYASKPSSLSRIGTKSFRIGVVLDGYRANLQCQKERVRMEEYPEVEIPMAVRAVTKLKGRMKVEMEGNTRIVLLRKVEQTREDARVSRYLIAEAVAEAILNAVFAFVPNASYYLPAARSSILQGHRVLAAGVFRQLPYVGIEKLEIPKFSGVVADFVSSVIALSPEEKGPFFQLAKEFEKQLTKGEIIMRPLEEYYPDIIYRMGSAEMPLHRASSSVAELAPIFLYLRHLVRPGSILVIEEPEAHLHPANQRLLAHLLVRLIRAGVSVLVTTHSEYLLEQLNTFLLMARVKPEQRAREYGYSEKDHLEPDEVGAYAFEPDKATGGHKVRKLEITSEGTIPEEEFLKVHEDLYEEALKLRKFAEAPPSG